MFVKRGKERMKCNSSKTKITESCFLWLLNAFTINLLTYTTYSLQDAFGFAVVVIATAAVSVVNNFSLQLQHKKYTTSFVSLHFAGEFFFLILFLLQHDLYFSHVIHTFVVNSFFSCCCFLKLATIF